MKRYMFAAGLALAASAAPASAAPFVNGDFEAPGGTDVRTQISNGSPAQVGSAFLTGWSYDAGTNGFEIYEDDQDGLAASSGTHYMSFGHNGATGGSISQTFDTVVGATYFLAYDVAEQQGDDASQNLQAILTNGADSLTHDNSALPAVFAPGAGFRFVALESSATITFLDATPAGGGGGSNLALDSISLNGSFGTSAVPEPASWAMMIGGFGMVGGAMRRRRTLISSSYA